MASPIICAKTWFVQTSCLLQVVRRDDQFRWRRLASPLWREAESFLISSYALLQTKTAWRIHLQKTGTGEFFLFTFPSSKHFCLLLEFRVPMKKIQKFETFFSWLLLSCPATTLTNYVFGSLFVLFSYFTFCFCFLSTILGQL